MPLMHRFLMWLTYRMPRRKIRRSETDPYLDRYFVGSLFGIRVYLHHFIAPDKDEKPHDHPWAWAFSVMLTGWYRESLVKGFSSRLGLMYRRDVIRRAPAFNLIRGNTIHRIMDCRADTWTLFIHGPKAKFKEAWIEDGPSQYPVAGVERGWFFYGQEPTDTGYRVTAHLPFPAGTTEGWERRSPSRATEDNQEFWKDLP